MSAVMQLVEPFPQPAGLSEMAPLGEELALTDLRLEEEFEAMLTRLAQLERENRLLRLELMQCDHELRKRSLLLRNALLREAALREQLVEQLPG
jgi:hypothetical protein